MSKAKVCLKRVDQKSVDLPRLGRRKRQCSHDNRPAQKAKDSVNYMFMDTTSGEETKTEKNVKSSDRSAPSGYRLAAHRYMVARKQGLITGPRTRTQALQIDRTSKDTSDDSGTTVDYVSDSAPPPGKCKRKQKTTSQGRLVTKSFVLRKDGKGTNQLVSPKPSERGSVLSNAASAISTAKVYVP